MQDHQLTKHGVFPDCEKRTSGGVCDIASELAGCKSLANPSACRYCLSHENPKAINRVTVSLAIPNASGDRKRKILQDHGGLLQHETAVRHEPHPSGCLAGTELKKLFGTFGLKPKAKCNCNKHARKMDENGCDWCEQHIDRISGWIKHECRKMGVPFVKPVVVAAIRLAISRARAKQLST